MLLKNIRDASAFGKSLISAVNSSAVLSLLGISGTASNIGDFSETTEPSIFDDFLAFWDASVSQNRKVAIKNMPPFNPRKFYYIYEDFISVGINGLSNNFSGSGATNVAVTWDNNNIGVYNFSTGNSASGRNAIIGSNLSAIVLGNSRWYISTLIKTPELSDATNTFILRSGLGDNATAESTDFIGFRYTDSVNSGSWQCVTRSNNNETVLNTTVAIVAGTIYRLEILINDAATNAEFFVNGVLMGSISTNIPSGTARALSHLPLFILKTAGTTTRNVQIDYYLALAEFTNPR